MKVRESYRIYDGKYNCYDTNDDDCKPIYFDNEIDVQNRIEKLIDLDVKDCNEVRIANNENIMTAEEEKEYRESYRKLFKIKKYIIISDIIEHKFEGIIFENNNCNSISMVYTSTTIKRYMQLYDDMAWYNDYISDKIKTDTYIEIDRADKRITDIYNKYGENLYSLCKLLNNEKIEQAYKTLDWVLGNDYNEYIM